MGAWGSSAPLNRLGRATAVAAVCAVGALAAPAAALAGSPPPTSPVAPGAPATAKPAPRPTAKPVYVPPPPPPTRASTRVELSDIYKVDHAMVTVPMRRIYLKGRERPFRHGQTVTVQAFLNGKQFEKRTMPLRYAGGKDGKFSDTLRVPGSGRVSVFVQHRRDDRMMGFRRMAARLHSLDENVGPGATGPTVKLIQQRLAALHFYIPQTGVFDTGTELALDAYHRLLGSGFAQTADPATMTALLNGQGSFKVQHPDQGEHAEGDLSDQLLALIDGSKVKMIFPISSGKPSTPTILGSYQIYLRTPSYLPDGMYYSSFFIRGYAIHGYDPAPDYPASHGCMRLPIPDAITAFDWLKLGDWVDTYYT